MKMIEIACFAVESHKHFVPIYVCGMCAVCMFSCLYFAYASTVTYFENENEYNVCEIGRLSAGGAHVLSEQFQ